WRAAVALGIGQDDLVLLDLLGGRALDRLVPRRQEEREGTALADRALDVDFPAEQPCDLAADRESEAGAAVPPARRPVGLLERLEDQAQILACDADAGVLHRELDHRVGAGQRLARELPSLGEADA